MELPENKAAINGKYKTLVAIKNAIYDALALSKVQGNYSDENWIGIQKLSSTLNNNGIQFELLSSDYEGHGKVENSNLPTKKVYRYELNIRNKEGNNISLFLKVTCAFVGKTGTMADSQYELTYYFF